MSKSLALFWFMGGGMSMADKRQIVLCVDDDPDDQLMVMDAILELHPRLKVASALNGIEALSFLNGAKERDELPCLVIMDINMPLIDGKQALALIKKDKVLAELPIVLFTTSSSQLDKSFAALHRVEFLTKPIKQGELIDTLKQVLSKCTC
jgi:CheY-like chemotaxis protein